MFSRSVADISRLSKVSEAKFNFWHHDGQSYSLSVPTLYVVVDSKRSIFAFLP